MSQETLELLLKRRSAKAALLTEPGPDARQLETILTAAARVPDHKRLEPWRFIIFEGDARGTFGRVLLKACLAEEKETPSAARLELERTRLLRAPVVVAVISRATPNPGAPEWEQILSCGAACFNLCLAANAMGFGTCWITEWYSYSPGVRAALGLAANERVAGFVYIGTAKETQPDRDRPQLAKIVTRWNG
ncbi:MAG TPA: nitroreductase [Hyphomicrobiaceae bacterium]|jgi:nitroreductase|nr:nitroreductase [Hyphomicrobiaceae bacterium]